jgi:hypothetical protein
MKTSEPDESVSVINIPELTDDLHPERFLRFDKFPVEEIDQHIPLSRMKRVLPQLNNRATSLLWLCPGNFHSDTLLANQDRSHRLFFESNDAVSLATIAFVTESLKIRKIIASTFCERHAVMDL